MDSRLKELRDKIVLVDALIHEDDCESKDVHSTRCKASGEVLGLFDALFPAALAAPEPAPGEGSPSPSVPAQPVAAAQKQPAEMSLSGKRMHRLKCHPQPFAALLAKTKTFEWRAFDRDYQIGDILILNEWDPEPEAYTGICVHREVTYLLSEGFGIPAGYCVMGIKPYPDPIPTAGDTSSHPSGPPQDSGGYETVLKADNERDKLWCAAILSVGLDMRDVEKIVSKALALRSDPKVREYLEVPNEIYSRFRPSQDSHPHGPGMVEWCREERAAGNGGCGACAMCCGELQKELDLLRARPSQDSQEVVKVIDNLIGAMDAWGSWEDGIPAEFAPVIADARRASALLSQSPKGAAGADKGEISDGYHTFNELYEHRYALFAVACRFLGGWKSKLHDDGTMFDGHFIAGLTTAEGPATYHLPLRLWDRFPGREVERAPAWDGHTPADVVARLWAHADAMTTPSAPKTGLRGAARLDDARPFKLRAEVGPPGNGFDFRIAVYLYSHDKPKPFAHFVVLSEAKAQEIAYRINAFEPAPDDMGEAGGGQP